MRSSYSIAIRTFNGAERVSYLLQTLENCAYLEKMKDLVIVEDHHPGYNHDMLLELVKKYPRWRLVTSPTWVNMQGTAQLALESCETDFVFLLSDDILVTGDPFRNVVNFLEFCSGSTLDITGAIALTHYDCVPDLVREGFIPWYKSAGLSNKAFYKDPLHTWYWRYGGPVHLSLKDTIVSFGRNVHGTAYCIKREAWEKASGYSPLWHADDQVISYRIWLNTEFVVYTLPTDPILHAGGMAQSADYHYEEGVNQGLEERCLDVFGVDVRELEKRLTPIIEERAKMYQEQIRKEVFEMPCFRWRFV